MAGIGKLRPRVVLIGGTSHAGKSSLAQTLAQRLDYESLSTDQLARHPGRPWRNDGSAVPAHVVQHYASLDTEALIDSVLRHYERMWPMVSELIERRAADRDARGLVLEGSALLPALAASVLGERVAGLWLFADEALIEARMRLESRFEEADAAGRALIAAFLARTRRYQRLVIDDADRLGLPRLEVRAGEPIETVADRVADLLGLAPA